VGDAADLLGMNDEERQLLDAQVQLPLAVRNQRPTRRGRTNLSGNTTNCLLSRRTY
jgi:hypothetical protein